MEYLFIFLKTLGLILQVGGTCLLKFGKERRVLLNSLVLTMCLFETEVLVSLQLIS